MTEEETKHIPDTARSYERAKPEKESPQGKLGSEKPPEPRKPDDHARQDQAPDHKQ